MDKVLYPNHPLRCITCGPSSSGKSVLITKLLLNIIKEYEKIFIYSRGLHQDLYKIIIKRSNNYIPIHIIPDILNEEGTDKVIEEVFNNKDF